MLLTSRKCFIPTVFEEGNCLSAIMLASFGDVKCFLLVAVAFSIVSGDATTEESNVTEVTGESFCKFGTVEDLNGYLLGVCFSVGNFFWVK